MHPPTHPSTQSPIHTPTHPLTLPSTHSPIHTHTHTHSLTHSLKKSNQKVHVVIDALTIIRGGGGGTNGLPLLHTADMVAIGSATSDIRLTLSNIHITGPSAIECDNPPLSETATCKNACFAATVVTDGSYNVTCVGYEDGQIAAGECAPLIGSVEQRCVTRNATADKRCRSGLRCV